MLPSHLEYEALSLIPIEKRLGYKPLPEDQRNQKTKDLNAQMSQHNGELMLVTAKWWDFVERGWSGCFGGRPDRFNLVEKNSLGLITAPFIIQEGKLLRFPTPAKVLFGRLDEEWVNTGASAKPDIGPTHPLLNANALGAPLEKRFTFNDYTDIENVPVSLDVLVGDLSVSDYFIKAAQELRMTWWDKYKMEEWRENDPEKYEARKAKLFNANIILRFQRMQTALGRTPLPIPAEIQQKVDAWIETQKDQVVGAIEGLELKRGSVHKLNVQRIFNKAFEWGLHREQREIRRKYGPGKTLVINVPEYIKGMAGRLGVSIPDEPK